jgi:TrmH family RNA methyltransferase
MTIRITSRDNERYKTWRKISRGNQSRGNLVFLEGVRLCADAHASAVSVQAILLSESAGPAARALAEHLPEGPARYLLPEPLFQGLSETKQPQGIAMIVSSPVLTEPLDPPVRDGLYLIAENIQDPGNLGAMIRTADAFAFAGVILTAGTVWPFSGKVLRASMGSCFHLPLFEWPDLRAVAQWLAQAGLTLLAADPDGAMLTAADCACGAALVIGNEAHGLSEQALDLCRRRIGITMSGRAESLNAACAAAILCHELSRLRGIGTNC